MVVVSAVLYGLLTYGIPESSYVPVSLGRMGQARTVRAQAEGSQVDLDVHVGAIEPAKRSEQESTLNDLLGGRRRLRLQPTVWVV